MPEPRERAAILLSFYFWRQLDLAAHLGTFEHRPIVFADSGGFSASSVGASIDLDEYAAWLDRWTDWIDVACTLDVVGDAEATYENTRRLEEHGHRVLPVFHVGEDFDWLVRYCQRYSFVGVGGMVPWASRPKEILRWLVACFRIAREHGTVIHGLGQTNPDTLSALPFYSVDSSSWVSAERFGQLYLWDAQRARLRSVHPVHDRREFFGAGELLRDHGLDPADMEPIVRNGKLHSPTSAGERVPIVRAASCLAWARMEAWWRGRHAPVEVEGMPPGPRLFYVCLDARQVTTIRQVWADGGPDHEKETHAAAAPS